MSVQLVVDMNLSVEWIAELAQHGWSAVHWSTAGDPRAEDSVIMAWALANRYVVFTHDLDFGTILALTHATGPSVLQVRCQNVCPKTSVLWSLRRCANTMLLLPLEQLSSSKRRN